MAKAFAIETHFDGGLTIFASRELAEAHCKGYNTRLLSSEKPACVREVEFSGVDEERERIVEMLFNEINEIS
jgi:hypothetical protein